MDRKQLGPHSNHPRHEFHGWRFAFIGAAMNALVSGFYGRGFSVYFLSLARDLNLNHTSTSMVFGLSALEGGIQSPITGLCIDRWGPRIMMIIGAVLAGLGFLLLPLANNFAMFILIFVGVISLGTNTGFHNGSAAIVTRWFVRNRGRAFGVISVGIAVGGSILTPIVAFIVMNHGWKMASTISGLTLLMMGVPLAWLVRNSPEELGQVPDGDTKFTFLEHKVPQITEFSVRQATRTWSYWLLAIGTTMRISAGSSIIVHIVPLMVWKGMSESTGAVVISVGSLAAIATRFFMGWIGDKWSKRKLVAIAMLVGAVSLIFLSYSPSKLPLMIVFGIALSVTDGAAGLTWAMVGDYFGKNSYATLKGGITSMVSIGAFASPVAAGKIFDVTKSYYMVLIIFAGVYLLGALIFLLLRGPQHQSISTHD